MRRFVSLVPFAALLLLSLLNGVPVLVRDLLPEANLAAWPPLEHAALLFACLGLVATAAAALAPKRAWTRASVADWQAGASIGLTLFAGPASLSAFASQIIPPLTVAGLETLALLFTSLLGPYLISSPTLAEEGQEPGAVISAGASSYGMLPSLIAFAGVLLVFPVFTPSSYSAALAFVAVLVGAASIGAGNCLLVRAASTGRSAITTAAIASLSAAVPLAALSFFREHPRLPAAGLNSPTLLVFVAELAALALLFALSRLLTATALATRVIWALLVPMLIEAATFRIPLPARSWIGIALMAAGASLPVLPVSNSSEPRGISLR